MAEGAAGQREPERRLQPGDSVWTWPAGQPVRIGREAGASSQFAVYAAEYGGQPAAVRWYHDGPPRGPDVEALSRLVQLGAGLDRAFAWPVAVLTCPGLPGAGLVGPPVEPRFQSLAQLLSRPDSPDFRQLAAIGISLVNSFRSLHARGLCHRDVHLGQVLADPATGEVVVLDFDAIAPAGLASLTSPGAPWAAPELIMRQADPSALTDLHALAVLLFYLFCHGSPVDGAATETWDAAATDEQLLGQRFGQHPVFVFDQADDSNRPAPDSPVRSWWKLYPPFFRALFTTAFTTGLFDPGRRVTEVSWLAALRRLAGSQRDCPACHAILLWHEEDPGQPCWNCGSVPPPGDL